MLYGRVYAIQTLKNPIDEKTLRRNKMGKEDEIRVIAYCIWEGEGYVHGHDSEHWFRAEAIWEEKQKKEAVSMNAKAESESTAKQRKWNNPSGKRR